MRYRNEFLYYFVYFKYRWLRHEDGPQFSSHTLNREELRCQKDIYRVKFCFPIQNFGMQWIIPVFYASDVGFTSY